MPDRPADRLLDEESFEFGFDGQLITDGDGVILGANEAAAGLLCSPKESLVGSPLGVLVAPADRPAFFNRLLGPPTGSTGLLEMRLGSPGGEPREVVAMVAPAGPDPRGRPARYRWVLRDVTEARRVEQELLSERELLQGVVNGADALILVVEPNGRILRSNPYLQKAQANALRAVRLAAIGQVAAGPAHESRNALPRSQACLSMLGLRLADRPAISGHHEAPLLERAAVDYVMPYLVKPVKPTDLQAAVTLAVSRFPHLQQARGEAADLRQALEHRKVVERAKDAVTRRVGVPEDDAYRLMRTVAGDHNKKVVDLARQILTAEETFRALEDVPGR